MTPMEMVNKNLYVYCDGNPIIKLDNTGHFGITAAIGVMLVGGVIGAGISAAFTAGTQYYQTGDINMKSVAVSALSGFISGVAAGSPLGLAEQVAVGTIIGGLSYLADCKVNSIPVDETNLAVAMFGGGLSGFIGGKGANVDNSLVETIQKSERVIARYSKQGETKFAKKMISRATETIKYTIKSTVTSGSVRFTAGMGASWAIGRYFSRSGYSTTKSIRAIPLLK